MKKRLLVMLFLSALSGFGIALFSLPEHRFSTLENRSLQTIPDFTVSDLASGEFAARVNSFFADQFPLRDGFVAVKGVAELLAGRGENDGILLGTGGTLARRSFAMRHAKGGEQADSDAFDPAFVTRATDGIRRAYEASDLPFCVLLPCRNIDVAASLYDYPDAFSESLQALLAKNLSGIPYLDAFSLFRTHFDAGEEVYYRTDHHWTTRGAYLAYREILGAFGMEAEILPEEAFLKETASETFFGSLWSAGGMRFVAPDRIEFWHPPDEDDFVICADGNELSGFYDRSFLTGRNQYAAFLGGTHDVVTVTKKGTEDRETLAIFRDSFADALTPFLAEHFDLVLFNLSSSHKDETAITDLAEEYRADRVLILYSVANLLTADRAPRFR